MEADAKAMGEEIKKAIDSNAQDTPSLNIDPQTEKPSIVGNPNNIPTTGGDYTIDFMYPPDMVTEEDKKTMKLDNKTGYYVATVKYTNKRVKPLYRGAVVVRLTNLFTATGVMKEDGYKKDVSAYAMGQAFQTHIHDVAMLAKEILGIPEDQIEYISPSSLSNFLTQLSHNEPNIFNESYNFLA